MKVIKIKDADYKQLNAYKIHHRQPMWEIIKIILSKQKGGMKNVNRNDKPSV